MARKDAGAVERPLSFKEMSCRKCSVINSATHSLVETRETSVNTGSSECEQKDSISPVKHSL